MHSLIAIAKNKYVKNLLDKWLDRCVSALKDKRDIHIVTNVMFDLFKKSNLKAYKDVGCFVRAIKRYSTNNKDKMIDVNTKEQTDRTNKQHFIMFNHLSHIPTVTDINDDIIVSLVSDFSIPQSHKITTNDVYIPPIVSPTKQSEDNQYPLLKSLNIDTNLDDKTNKEQIVNLPSELVYLFKSSEKDLNFIHCGNDKHGILIPIPRAKNYTTFN